MIELQKSKILQVVVKAYKELPLDVRKAVTGLADEAADELIQFFEGLLKIQAPMSQVTDSLLRCCADVALALCNNEQGHPVAVKEKFYNELYRFLGNLVLRLKVDFEEQIKQETKTRRDHEGA